MIETIFSLFERFGAHGYGEALSLERHMLQTAALAEERGAADALIAAALLHDIGFFLDAENGAPTDAEPGRGHETLGAVWLARGFDEAVTAPIALHVQAKRYLCAVDLGYAARLSKASRLSLKVQGGAMTAGEAAAFEAEPAFAAAVLLRRCDDGGKDGDARTRPVGDYRRLLTDCLRRSA